jgi:hypothetical protein
LKLELLSGLGHNRSACARAIKTTERHLPVQTAYFPSGQTAADRVIARRRRQLGGESPKRQTLKGRKAAKASPRTPQPPQRYAAPIAIGHAAPLAKTPPHRFPRSHFKHYFHPHFWVLFIFPSLYLVRYRSPAACLAFDGDYHRLGAALPSNSTRGPAKHPAPFFTGGLVPGKRLRAAFLTGRTQLDFVRGLDSERRDFPGAAF